MDSWKELNPHWEFRFYDDAACVVARLKGRAEGKGAVLLNAHIDSAANAPGASDDLLAVGVLLEALRYFATHRPARDIIVLINGAEETHQLAAHAFATQHPDAKDVQFVVNLESMGSGGREFIFRCAGEDVARALRGTTVARGSVLAEELASRQRQQWLCAEALAMLERAAAALRVGGERRQPIRRRLLRADRRRPLVERARRHRVHPVEDSHEAARADPPLHERVRRRARDPRVAQLDHDVHQNLTLNKGTRPRTPS